ncbi:MAG TPA: acyltransferase [Symbiobacteriaceae bacterium]|jgi:peptidoglycan/LPS O-acetylase OafA/YrhL
MHTRYYVLDGLRGYAAVMVFFSHALGMLPPAQIPFYLRNSVLHFLWDGSAAVDLFFVLSGFCLALPYLDVIPRKLDYAEFSIRRGFRIYPTYVAGLLLALVLRFWVFDPAGLQTLSEWVRGLWVQTPTFKDLAKHLLFVWPSFDTHKIDPVIWSLVIEMRISLAFPLAVWALKRWNSWQASLAILGLSFMPMIFVQTFMYLPLFVLGGVLALHRRAMVAWVQARTEAQVAGLGLIALALYACQFAVPGWRPDPNALSTHFMIGAGSGMIIILSLGRPRFHRLMSCGLSRFLGGLSYSFYLLHLPILLTVSSRVFAMTHSLVLAWSASMVAALGTAYLSQKWLEEPTNSLGRWVAGGLPTWLRNRRQATFAARRG